MEKVALYHRGLYLPRCKSKRFERPVLRRANRRDPKNSQLKRRWKLRRFWISIWDPYHTSLRTWGRVLDIAWSPFVLTFDVGKCWMRLCSELEEKNRRRVRDVSFFSDPQWFKFAVKIGDKEPCYSQIFPQVCWCKDTGWAQGYRTAPGAIWDLRFIIIIFPC